MEVYYQPVVCRLNQEPRRRKSGLYIHYPFCQTKCSYCHFVSSGYEPESHRRWLSAAQEEIRRAADLFSEHLLIDTVYFGGGTPSLLDPDEVGTLLASIRQNFEAELQEVTLEVNPAADPERIKGWLRAGVSRLSFGVQSFDPAVLEVLGRVYLPEKVARLLDEARKAGADNISLDLMAGVPGESSRTIEINLKTLLELKPNHVSVYLLEELEKVPFRVVWEKAPVSEEVAARIYEDYRLRLEAAGWLQYEIANFSQPGYQCRHNLKYWRYQPFLGIGPSASSHLANFRWTNPVSFSDWLAAITSGNQSFSEFLELTPEEELRECLAFGLRLREGVLLSELKSRFPGLDFTACETRSKQLATDGLLQVDDGRVRIRPEKFLISNSIIGELLY